MCIRTYIALLLIVASMASCRTATEAEFPPELTGTEWELTAFQQPNGLLRDVGSQGIRTTFFEDGIMEGYSYTFDDENWEGNAYVSTYELGDNQTLTIAVPELSKQFQILPHGSRWFEFQDALARAESFNFEETDLLIVYGGNHVLRFGVFARPEK